jgi:hypothetical protein
VITASFKGPSRPDRRGVDDFRHRGTARRRCVMQSTADAPRGAADCAMTGAGIK